MRVLFSLMFAGLFALAISCSSGDNNGNSGTVGTTSAPTPTPGPSATPGPRHVQNGNWGGQGIKLTVMQDNSVYELDCAHGTIDGALNLNSQNQFHNTGSITIEHGGPVHPGEQLPTFPATYDGTVAGIMMHLTIKYNDGQDRSNSYDLVFNQAPRLIKCL
jgi:hypothetical protein